MTQDERDAFDYVGCGPDHPMWQELPKHIDVAGSSEDQSLSRLNSRLEQLDTAAGRIDYSRAPRHLINEQVLTLAGSDWLSDLIVFLLFVFVFLPWLFFQFISTIESGIWDMIRGIFGM
jgi:hypothetical protein